MLDLVKHETERIESRFLEPACGNGNFLAEILQRKLRLVESRYQRSQLEYERNAVLAVCSIYGMDKLQENVLECRQRLLGIFAEAYTRAFKSSTKAKVWDAVKFILERNIIHGDALTLQTVGPTPKAIVFSEWSFPFHNSFVKRRDFSFSDLLTTDAQAADLFLEPSLVSEADIDSALSTLGMTCAFATFADQSVAGSFARLVYAVRNSIVHNKETEFHLTYASLDPTIIALIETFLIPSLEEICFSLIGIPNTHLWYQNRELLLYR